MIPHSAGYPMKAARTLKLLFLVLIGLSFAACTLLVVVDAGMWNTPYDTTDSAGRRMGFNDPLSWEHWGILLSNFRIEKLLAAEYTYAGLLLAMHLVTAWLILRTGSTNRAHLRWFLAAQGLLFPLGWLGFFTVPQMIRWLGNGTFDREAIIDVPFVAVTAQPLWLLTALAILTMTFLLPARLQNPTPSYEASP